MLNVKVEPVDNSPEARAAEAAEIALLREKMAALRTRLNAYALASWVRR